MSNSHVTCSCGKRYRLSEAAIGKQIKCPSCGALIACQAPEAVLECPNIADLLDEPDRAGVQAMPYHTSSPLPTMRDPHEPKSVEAKQLYAELQALKQRIVGTGSELGTLASLGRRHADQAVSIQSQAQQSSTPNTGLGTVAGFAVGGPLGWFVGAAVGSIFSGRGRMDSAQRAAFDVASGDGSAFSGAAGQARGSLKTLQRRQAALEEVLRGDSSLLASVHRLGAALLAALAFAAMGIAAYISARIHPLLGAMLLPLTVPIGWVWWRTDLKPLGDVLRDHPAVYRPGAWRMANNPLYPLLCVLALLCGGLTTFLAGALLWGYAVSFFINS